MLKQQVLGEPTKELDEQGEIPEYISTLLKKLRKNKGISYCKYLFDNRIKVVTQSGFSGEYEITSDGSITHVEGWTTENAINVIKENVKNLVN